SRRGQDLQQYRVNTVVDDSQHAVGEKGDALAYQVTHQAKINAPANSHQADIPGDLPDKACYRTAYQRYSSRLNPSSKTQPGDSDNGSQSFLDNSADCRKGLALGCRLDGAKGAAEGVDKQGNGTHHQQVLLIVVKVH